MTPPDIATIPIRFTSEEHKLLEDLAQMRGMSMSDVVRELMGFERGVTVQGGLPAPITTPAHGTAFDIVGQGKANAEAMTQAFLLAAKMGAARLI